jgi:hypothetical protein
MAAGGHDDYGQVVTGSNNAATSPHPRRRSCAVVSDPDGNPIRQTSGEKTAGAD